MDIRLLLFLEKRDHMLFWFFYIHSFVPWNVVDTLHLFLIEIFHALHGKSPIVLIGSV